jgi:hypothetical protein
LGTGHQSGKGGSTEALPGWALPGAFFERFPTGTSNSLRLRVVRIEQRLDGVLPDERMGDAASNLLARHVRQRLVLELGGMGAALANAIAFEPSEASGRPENHVPPETNSPSGTFATSKAHHQQTAQRCAAAGRCLPVQQRSRDESG